MTSSPTTPEQSTPQPQAALRRKAADTIRVLAMDAVQRADSGHPGMPMGMADAAVVLWTRFLRFDPQAPDWFNRDRFVLSAGHGSMLLYSLLHLTGYDLSMDELKRFRQLESLTPGHPEFGLTPGVEATTGPLGQGLANGIGMAAAERHLAARFNQEGFDLVDHRTFVIASDGDLMEGVTNEASSLAGHWKLGRLIVLYDDNEITIDGDTDLAFTEDVLERYRALGWHTDRVDGHDPVAVEAALEGALADERPSIIACRTHIGYGSPNRQGSSEAHGSPLGDEEIALTKKALGWTAEPFEVPGEVYDFMRQAAAKGHQAHVAWDDRLRDFGDAHPDLLASFETALAGTPPQGWVEALADAFEVGGMVATRKASGAVLNALKPRWPALIGGSADLTPSNNTRAKGDVDFSASDYGGRYLRFGVREHAMGSILNGMNVHGGVRAYGGTFLIFSDYMRPAIRLAALSNAPSIFVFTHDSIGLGEDGPTHQPIEHLAALRAIPNLTVLRPADAYETVICWDLAASLKGPVALALTRQSLPVLDASAVVGARRGGYILSERDDAQVILIATGSEVHLALSAQRILDEEGIRSRVVSLPSIEVFDKQPADYREQVLPSKIIARVSVEAGVTQGWHRFVGPNGVAVGLSRFGESAPYQHVYEHLGMTVDAVAEAARRSLKAVEDP
ncbi:MAG TPA: transketolase [Rhodothermales bacterium]|nr:transketolase [Rhodothermales bacterium]